MCDFAICQYCSKELNFSCLILEGMGEGEKYLSIKIFVSFFLLSRLHFKQGEVCRERSSRGVVTLLFSLSV